ncbi:MAG: hypothetical protein E6J90_13855 [Deltaproteobacteria bacterium]|nr:MAG: hypothetical protein E6J90_13855 [Deltaproteobacteria bacterium]
MRRGLVAVLAVLAITAGCGGHCAEIAARRRALDRTGAAAGPHAQVVIPFARANAFLAALVRDPPLRAPLALPELGPFALAVRELTAQARRVELRPAAADRLRFAIELEIDDAAGPVTALAVVAEVTPELVRAGDASELVAGFGPDNLVAVRPELGGDSGRALVDAVARWLPAALRDHLPRAVLDRAAVALAQYLTGQAYDLLRATVLHRLGELTRLRIRLPALPIARTAVTSTPDAMTIDLTTDLPVRQGLGAAAAGSDDVIVRISQSTAAELANWSIARGHLPQHYTRGLEPRADGEYRPRFDYLAGDPRRPVKIHVFQDRGGCSYFQVGLRYQLAIVDDKLEVDVRDRLVESADASVALEVALWLKQLLQGSLDSSYRAAAHTRLTIGGHRFVARVLGATATGDELRFTLGFAAAPTYPNGQSDTVRP